LGWISSSARLKTPDATPLPSSSPAPLRWQYDKDLLTTTLAVPSLAPLIFTNVSLPWRPKHSRCLFAVPVPLLLGASMCSGSSFAFVVSYINLHICVPCMLRKETKGKSASCYFVCATGSTGSEELRRINSERKHKPLSEPRGRCAAAFSEYFWTLVQRDRALSLSLALRA
jgi:hypothetical protein